MKICWIGTGVMGEPMAGHLLDAGHSVAVHTRTAARAAGLVERGATWCVDVGEAARDAEVVCTMVGFPRDVEQVVLGPGGVLETAREGALSIDFTTSSPALARRVAGEAAGRGMEALDAPVSGGDVGAREATLSIMVGGTTGAFERGRPLLDLLGRTVVLQGEAGAGQHTKMTNQILIATTMIGVCEGLVYARRSGLDPERVLRSVGGGAAASWSLRNLYPRMVRGDYEPGFMIAHFVKDMEIALEECRRMGLDLPGLGMAHELYRSLRDEGFAEKGTHALVRAIEKLNP